MSEQAVPAPCGENVNNVDHAGCLLLVDRDRNVTDVHIPVTPMMRVLTVMLHTLGNSPTVCPFSPLSVTYEHLSGRLFLNSYVFPLGLYPG